MARRDIILESVRATDKDSNVMAITFKVGCKTVTLHKDCTNKNPYEWIDDYISDNGLSVTKRFERYEENPIMASDIDHITRKLKELDKQGHEPYNTPLFDFMRFITN